MDSVICIWSVSNILTKYINDRFEHFGFIDANILRCIVHWHGCDHKCTRNWKMMNEMGIIKNMPVFFSKVSFICSAYSLLHIVYYRTTLISLSTYTSFSSDVCLFFFYPFLLLVYRQRCKIQITNESITHSIQNLFISRSNLEMEYGKRNTVILETNGNVKCWTLKDDKCKMQICHSSFLFWLWLGFKYISGWFVSLGELRSITT